MTQPSVVIRLSAVGQGQVEQALGGVEAGLGKVQGAIQKASHYGGALAVALGTDLLGRLGAIGRSAVQAADDMTNMASRLGLVSGSAVHVAQAQARLFEIAQSSRMSFVALADTYGALARAGSNLGVSQDRMLTVTEAVAQAMALSGGSAESMRAALVQLGQGLASGTLRGEELNSIMEQAPRLAQAMADGLGVPLGRLRSLGEQGKLTSQEVIRALEKSGPQLAKELAQSTLTVGQAMTTLGNSVTRAIGQLDKTTGSSAAAASALKALSGGIDAVGKAARENEGAIKLIGGVITGTATAAALVASLAGVRLAIAAIGGALVAHPAVAILLGIGAAVGAVVSVVARRREEMQSLAGKMQELGIEEDKLARRRAMRGENNMSDPLSVAMEGNVARLRQEVLDAKQRARDEFRKFEAADMGRASGPFPGAKDLDEVRKYFETDIDIRRKYADERREVEQSFQQRIFQTSDDTERAALQSELRKRLAGMRQQEAADLDQLAAKRSADVRAAAAAAAKLSLSEQESISGENIRRSKRELEALEEDNRAGIVSATQYAEKKLALERAVLAEEIRIAEARLRAEQATPANPGAGGADTKTAALVALRGQLAALREQEAAASTRADDDLERLDKAQLARTLQENKDYHRQRLDAALGSVTALIEANRAGNIALIHDDRARGEAQIALFREQELAKIEALKKSNDPEEYARAQEAVNEAVRQKQVELTESLKPEWQRMLEGWKDTAKLMKAAMDNAMTGTLKGAEDAFVSLVTTGKANLKSLVNVAIAEFARAQFRQAMAGLVKWAAGAFGPSNTQGAGGDAIKNALGGVFAPAGSLAFAAGGVVTGPTNFHFAQGGALRKGLMGEAGPEAIMPLRRAADGSLGVVAQGSGGTTFNITVAGDATANTVRMIETALAKYDRQRRQRGD